MKKVKFRVVDSIWGEVADHMTDGAFHSVWAYVGRQVHRLGGRTISDITFVLNKVQHEDNKK